MNLCSHYHDEVCYDGHDCPVCEKMKEIAELEHKVKELEKDIERLQEEESA